MPQPRAAAVLPTVASQALRRLVVDVEGASAPPTRAEELGAILAVLAELRLHAAALAAMAAAAIFPVTPAHRGGERTVSEARAESKFRPAAPNEGCQGALRRGGATGSCVLRRSGKVRFAPECAASPDDLALSYVPLTLGDDAPRTPLC